MNFPELLRRKLRYTGYTQEYVAKQIGVSATTVYYWASNRARPTIENIRKLEQLLNCQQGELFVALAYPTDEGFM